VIFSLAKRIRQVCLGVALVGIAALPAASRADTVASLLGNFTINQFCGVLFSEGTVNVRYTVVFGQLPALAELRAADADGDGVTSQTERDAHVERLAPAFADQLKLVVDGAVIPLKLAHATTSLPTEQGGFSLRLDVDFVGALPPFPANRVLDVKFANQNYAGRFGWREIAVEGSPSLSVFATDAFSTSLTSGLNEALAAMPATGPLDERSISLRLTDSAPPAGARLLQPRGGTVAVTKEAPSEAPGILDNAWLQRETRRLVDRISAPEVAPAAALFALLAAALLGALHAFSPGHGKTIVGAYLIGSRATPRHAVFLGATVTATHTLGVFALGFATLFASRFIVPERLFPVLSLLSGLLVLGMGVVLLVQRWRSLAVLRNRPGHVHGQRADLGTNTTFRPLAAAPRMNQSARHFVVAYAGGVHDHGHGHLQSHAAGDARADTPTHSHGGRVHSHFAPGAAGDEISWRSLLALGISGGLVPCPSAMVLLLAAVALNKIAFGMLLVLAFSAGLALTLIAVGLAFLYARNRIRQPAAGARWLQLLPVLSAGAITLLGGLLCYGALTGAQF
jgi:nickel/cobalt transporter (NicO) family protein